MPRSRLSSVVLSAFVLWTAFVWISRISNTLRSTTESTGGKAFSTALSVVMLLFAAGVVLAWLRAGSGAFDPAGQRLLRVASVATVIVWLVRVPQIVFLDDDPTHGAPFKIVHAVLGLISIVLAAGVWKVASDSVERPRAPSGTPAAH